MPGQLVTIATFDLVPKARLAQNTLEKAGIKSVVTDENIVAMDWLFGNAVGWVKLQVLEEDAERAVAALEESLGTSGEPVDEESLAAEAMAANQEKDAESTQSRLESPRSLDRMVGSSAVRLADATPTDETEPQPSERDQYAHRLFLSSVFSFIFPPLWFYGIYLFLNAQFGEGPISEHGRTELIRGALLLGAGLLFLFLFSLSIGMFE
jgi:hypothetical protein